MKGDAKLLGIAGTDLTAPRAWAFPCAYPACFVLVSVNAQSEARSGKRGVGSPWWVW
jgi:hypothetical protein